LIHSPHGWGWIDLVTKGDFLNYTGVVLLAMMTVICYMVLVKGYLAKKRLDLCFNCYFGNLVLLLAASGLLEVVGINAIDKLKNNTCSYTL